MRETKFSKKSILLVAIMVIVVAILGIVYKMNATETAVGSKIITIEVVNKDKESVVYELKTDAEYLRQAMEEADGLRFDGEEGIYGIMVTTVNGEKADYNTDGAYWSFYVNDEYCNYGIDSQPVFSGDNFLIKYTKSITE